MLEKFFWHNFRSVKDTSKFTMRLFGLISLLIIPIPPPISNTDLFLIDLILESK